MSRNVLAEAVEELEAQQKILQGLIDGLRAVIGFAAAFSGTVPVAAPVLPVAAETPKRKYVRKTPAGWGMAEKRKPGPKPKGQQRQCSKHPDSDERDSNGACSNCRREKQRVPPELKMRPGRRPAAVPPSNDRKPEEELPEALPRSVGAQALPDDYEYSKPITCPKCKTPNTRMRRNEDADPKTDNWVCMANGCLVRIAHIVLAVDHRYEGQ